MKHNFIEDNIIILSRQTMDLMLKEEYPSELIALYCFYYYTAKWQQTNAPKCTTGYVMNGLRWTKEKVIRSKKALKRLGLIEDVVRKNNKGQITGWYIKLHYIWKKENTRRVVKNQKVAEPEGGKTHPVDKPDTNALSDNNINTLNDNNINALSVSDASVANLNKLIEMFKPINPSYKRLFANKTQRAALVRLVKEFGEEKLIHLLGVLPKIMGERYAPTITTPCQLENKMGQLMVFFKRESNKKPNLIKI